MSFRYTNNLIGVLKHRLALEAAHRDIARCTFTGLSNGVKVTCSGYGTVLRIELVDRDVYQPFYTVAAAAASSIDASAHTIHADNAISSTGEPEGQVNSFTSTTKTAESLDLSKLAVNIKAALWDAIRKIQSVKMAAHHSSLVDNEQMLSHGRLQHWYEQNIRTIQPRPCDALKQELATSWMQAVRFGKPDADRFLGSNTKQDASKPDSMPLPTHGDDDSAPADAVGGEGILRMSRDVNRSEHASARGVTVLTREDCHVANIPIGSVHPLFTSALTQLEEEHQRQEDRKTLSDGTRCSSQQEVKLQQTTIAVWGANGKKTVSEGSRICGQAVLREFKKEMSRDELRFWERVELIRRGQLANIPGGVKRGYVDQTSTTVSNIDDKVELRFTQ